MKKISLLLALMMIVSVVACACGDATPTGEETTAPPSTTATPGETTAPPETSIYDALPNEVIEDYSFDFLTVDVSWTNYEGMCVEEVSGEMVNDEIFRRNQMVGEKLGVTFSEKITTAADAMRIIQAQNMSGDKFYDLYSSNVEEANRMAVAGQLADLNEIESFDFSRPWWDSEFADYVNFTGDRQYIAFGDVCLVLASAVFVLGFNTEMVERYGFTSPYTLYQEGKWTWEELRKMCVQVNTDKNGDNRTDSLDADQFGMVGHLNQIKHLMMATGASLVTEDAEQILVMKPDNERYYDVFTRVMEWFINDPSVFFSTTHPDYATYNSGISSGESDYSTVFSEGRALFMMDTVSAFKACRESDVPYGIVGLPKYDDAQQDYYVVPYSGLRGITIPSGFDEEELETIATIIEWLSAYSNEHIIPAFVENTLYYRYARDQISVEILSEIMAQTKFNDLAIMYNWAGIISLIEQMQVGHRTEIASALKGIEKKFNKQIEQTIGSVTQ